jgi:hypothetical protein
MTAVVSVETVLLVLLVVLVAGLLRSHAEILRRLGPEDATSATEPQEAPVGTPHPIAPPRRTAAPRAAPVLSGTTPAGDAVTLAFEGGAGMLTLLAFLTTGCSTCAGFWATLAEPRLPAGVQTVIVTRGSDRERPARVRELAPPEIPVIMSSAAWSDFGVPGAPYFVLVERSVLGEGVATTWQALASLVADAVQDEREGAVGPAASGRAPAGARRAQRIDDTLAAGGIGPGHPSLYPAGEAPR